MLNVKIDLHETLNFSSVFSSSLMGEPWFHQRCMLGAACPS